MKIHTCLSTIKLLQCRCSFVIFTHYFPKKNKNIVNSYHSWLVSGPYLKYIGAKTTSFIHFDCQNVLSNRVFNEHCSLYTNLIWATIVCHQLNHSIDTICEHFKAKSMTIVDRYIYCFHLFSILYQFLSMFLSLFLALLGNVVYRLWICIPNKDYGHDCAIIFILLIFFEILQNLWINERCRLYAPNKINMIELWFVNRLNIYHTVFQFWYQSSDIRRVS